MLNLLLIPSIILSISSLASTQSPSVAHLGANSEVSLPPLKSIIDRTINRYKTDNILKENYVYCEDSIIRFKDANGKLVKEETKKFEILRVHGKSLKRLIEKNGKAVSGRDREKEDDRISKEIETLEADHSSARLTRMDPMAFFMLSDLTNLQREIIDGQSVFSVDFKPPADFAPKNKSEEIIELLAGKIYIDEMNYEVLCVDARLIKPISVFLRLGLVKDGRVVYKQKRVNHEIALPASLQIRLNGRALFSQIKIEMESTFSDYKKFEIESPHIEPSQESAKNSGLDKASL